MLCNCLFSRTRRGLYSQFMQYLRTKLLLFGNGINFALICIGNYTVREVLMKNRTRVWRNVYNIASA